MAVLNRSVASFPSTNSVFTGFFMLLILAFLLLQNAPQNVKPQKQQSQSTKSASKSNQPIANILREPPTTPNTYYDAPNYQIERKKESNDSALVMELLTAAYVLINIFILLAIKRQATISDDSLKVFRNQVTASETQFIKQLAVMETNAAAAKTSADAFVGSERSWVL